MVVSFLIEFYSFFVNPEEWKSWPHCKKLRLQTLPQLAVVEILKSMNQQELIKLALTSKKCAEMCRIGRMRAPWYRFHIRDDYTTMVVHPTTLFCGGKKHADLKDMVEFQDLTKWFKPSTPLKNLAGVFEQVHSIISSRYYDLFIYTDYIENTTIEQIMDVPFLKNCQHLVLIRGEIDSKDLCLLLDSMKELEYIRISKTKVPIEFQHEKALLIKNIEYSDANWVTLENLFSMKDNTNVKLGTNTFTYSDLNRFLKFWVNNNVDMFLRFYVKMEEVIDPRVLFDGLLRLDSLHFSVPVYFIIAHSNMVNKERSLLCVYHTEGELRFLVYSRTSLWENGHEKSTFHLEFDALRIMEQREELMRKMDRVDGDDMRKIEELNTQLDGLLQMDEFVIGE